jgi:5-methylcytosine-specific restriction endonuclease McrA
MRLLSTTERSRARFFRRHAYRRQYRLCYWCFTGLHEGAPSTDPQQSTADHRVPLHAGGRTVPGNIVAACRDCNTRRHPEMNRGGGGLVATVGDSRGVSPFACLAGAFA